MCTRLILLVISSKTALLKSVSDPLFSDSYPQHMDVPQGSVLSVTLFSIKMDSIAGVLQDSTIGFSFVDDFAFSFIHRQMDIIELYLQTCLHHLELWTDKNGFKFF